ncbi:MAG: (Fe-S)-binding protein [Planctomycetaceae bacterium]
MSIADLSRSCVHCGLCLPACPTYAVLREEADSPRGRIALLEAFDAGRADAADVRLHIDRCIGCRACESVCPSGVRYGELLEEGRARLGGPGLRARLFLRHLLPRPRLLGALTRVGRWLGRLPSPPPSPAWPTPPARPKARVALHAGCVTPALYPHLAAEAAVVLTRLGYAVEAPPGQVCCGALHRHAGLRDDALRETNARALRGYDVVLSAAAGCSTTPGLTDLTKFLLDQGPIPGASLPGVVVAYHAPCHLRHAQQVDATALLDRIEGLVRVPLAGAGNCCGAGGLYMSLQGRLARAVRETTLDAVEASGAAIVASGNPGCMLWLARGLARRRVRVEVLHPVTLLARAMGGKGA